MSPDKAEKLLKELNTPGSALNKKYLAWKKNPMTNQIADLLYYMSSPDKVVAMLTNVRGTGNEAACTQLGYVMGRSHTVTEMMSLDVSAPVQPKDVPETFTEEEE